MYILSENSITCYDLFFNTINSLQLFFDFDNNFVLEQIIHKTYVEVLLTMSCNINFDLAFLQGICDGSKESKIGFTRKPHIQT